jgi:hypothetical protein
MCLGGVHPVDQAGDKITDEASNSTHRAPNPLVTPSGRFGIRSHQSTQDGMAALSRVSGVVSSPSLC